MPTYHVVANDRMTTTGSIDDEDFPSRKAAQAELVRLGLADTYHVVKGSVVDVTSDIIKGTKG
jgi:hypothetical protein